MLAALMQPGDNNTDPLIDALLRRPAWHEHAACRDADTGLFFPTDRGPATEARGYCNRCPVRGDCLDDALERTDTVGIWGGTSTNERRALRRTRAA